MSSGADLFVRLEDVALEDVAGAVPGDVTPDLQVLGVVGHVENPAPTNTKTSVPVREFNYNRTYCTPSTP